MDLTPSEWTAVTRFALGGGVVIGIYFLSCRTQRYRQTDSHGLVAALVDERSLSVAVGVALGFAVVGVDNSDSTNILSLSLMAAVGWCGIAVGCGMELRVLQRASPVLLALELAQGGLALGIVWVFLLGAATVADMQFLADSVGGVLFLTALIVADWPMKRLDSVIRSRSGSHYGLWEPSIAALIAVILVAFGSQQMGTELSLGFMQWNSAEQYPPQSGWKTVVDLLASHRILGSLVIGALIGLLCDLASRENNRAGGLFFVVCTLALIVGGVAATLALEPLVIGLSAGIWFVNATLRRLDVVHIVERGRYVLRSLLPLLVGLVIGIGIDSGFDPALLVTTFVIIPPVRYVVKLAGLQAGGRLRGNSVKQISLRQLAEASELDQTGLAVALSLAALLPLKGAVAVLAGVVLGDLLLRLFSGWAARRSLAGKL